MHCNGKANDCPLFEERGCSSPQQNKITLLLVFKLCYLFWWVDHCCLIEQVKWEETFKSLIQYCQLLVSYDGVSQHVLFLEALGIESKWEYHLPFFNINQNFTLLVMQKTRVKKHDLSMLSKGKKNQNQIKSTKDILKNKNSPSFEAVFQVWPKIFFFMLSVVLLRNKTEWTLNCLANSQLKNPTVFSWSIRCSTVSEWHPRH